MDEEVFKDDVDLMLFDPYEPWKRTRLKAGQFTLRELMIPLFVDGKCVYESPKTMDIRAYCLKEQDTLWEESRRLVNPHQVYVDLSKKLYDTKISLLDNMDDEVQT